MISNRLFLKANALQYTLIIGVVIFISILSLILYFNLNTLFSLRTDSIVNQLEQQENAFFFPEDYPQFSKKNKDWGAYQIQNIAPVEAIDNKNNIGISRSALISYKWDHLGLPQLFLKNDLSSLQLSGKTTIEGDVYCPNALIKTTSVASKIYEGPELNNLTILSSSPNLPSHPLENKTFEEWQDFSLDSIVAYQQNFDYTRKFNQSSIAMISDIDINLYEAELTGQIKIISQTKIVVHQNANLNDVLLIAPVIVFKEGVKGNIHAVARDSIKVAKNVELSYPSSLTTAKSSFSPAIIIDEFSTVEGMVHQFDTVDESTNYSQLEISKNAQVKGVIFNKGNTLLKGTVEGSLFTSSFRAYEKGSIYRNFIIDGVIRKPDWIKIMGETMSLDNKNVQPVKWLY